MSLKRFCDGCNKRIRSGYKYTEVRIINMNGEPLQGGEFHLGCWNLTEEYKQHPPQDYQIQVTTRREM